MIDIKLTQLRDLIQIDVGRRGLRTDPVHNLISACPDDFAHACQSLAKHPKPSLAIVTGFLIPDVGMNPPAFDPAATGAVPLAETGGAAWEAFAATGSPRWQGGAGETDGPLGALFLARALVPLGIPVTLITDDFCVRALEAGLSLCGLRDDVLVVTLPTYAHALDLSPDEYRRHVRSRAGDSWTHLLAIERVGPSHHGDRCHTMRGRDITESMSPAHRLFESTPLTTIGIGDGGNEIGMGKIPRDVIGRNIPNGNLVACRVATQHLIVCGVSNWGAYALAAGVALVRRQSLNTGLFDPQREHAILEHMVRYGALVDGVRAEPSVTVDGLTWERYVDVLTRVEKIV